MSSPPEEPEPVLRHRPLPSVDIALLPGDVRAARIQRWSIGAAALVIVVVALGFAFGPGLWARRTQHGEPTDTTPWPTDVSANGTSASTAPTAPVAAAPAQPWPAADAAVEDKAAAATEGRAAPATDNATAKPAAQPAATAATSSGAGPAPATATPTAIDMSPGRAHAERKFGDAHSFKDALHKAGASADEANQLIAALSKLIDFRHCRPEHVLVIERGPEGELNTFEYRTGPTEIFRATRGAAGKLRAERIEVPVERRRVEKGTHVAGTLGASLASLGLGPALAGVVIEAFDAKISFKRDARTGDSVKLILDEEYVNGAFLRYGAVHAIEYTSERAGKLQAFWFEKTRGEGEFYDPSGRAMHGGWLRTPLRYDHVSSGYNLKRRHPILKRIMPHLGIDYSAGTGTPVWAAADGVVTFAASRGANGNLVSLTHGNGYESHYAHLWRIAAGIRAGVQVKQRRVIGYVGTTGRSTGPHLHFALRRNGHFLDPATQLNGPGLPLPAAALPRFKAAVQRLRADLDHINLAAAPKAGAPAAQEGPEDTADEEEIEL
ncbi:MAG TPA: M23 family metallopeptidase [Polyangiales bacterium]